MASSPQVSRRRALAASTLSCSKGNARKVTRQAYPPLSSCHGGTEGRWGDRARGIRCSVAGWLGGRLVLRRIAQVVALTLAASLALSGCAPTDEATNRNLIELELARLSGALSEL